MNGLAHPDYAGSLAEFGLPRELPSCGGWVLERPIEGCQDHDAMGCYPLFVCRDWSQLHTDLRSLEDDLVCLSMVTDPFGKYDEVLLHDCFDKVIPFKQHYVTDLSQPIEQIVTRHHRKYARKALRSLSVEVSTEPIRYLDEWTALYAELATRFNARGIRAFSRNAFARQLTIPGVVMFRVLHQGTVVAAHLHFLQDRFCYGNLAGISALGQELMASYALYWSEIEYFTGKADWIDWGAGAGIKAGASDGLTQFKQGWSTGTRTSWFCGRILNQKRYAELAATAACETTGYFPAYRSGEFG